MTTMPPINKSQQFNINQKLIKMQLFKLISISLTKSTVLRVFIPSIDFHLCKFGAPAILHTEIFVFYQ